MSNQAIDTFRQQVNSNPALAERLRTEGTSPEAIVRIAEDAGCRFTVADLNQGAAGELADDQLESVAGGRVSHRTSKGLDEPPFQFMIDWIFGQNR